MRQGKADADKDHEGARERSAEEDPRRMPCKTCRDKPGHVQIPDEMKNHNSDDTEATNQVDGS